jgi:hypothetical protein
MRAEDNRSRGQLEQRIIGAEANGAEDNRSKGQLEQRIIGAEGNGSRG